MLNETMIWLSGVGWFFVLITSASVIYLLIALYAIVRSDFNHRPSTGFTPPITILKPLCGLDFQLYENLRSFCQQDYPTFQVIFGVANASDPAIPVVRRLQEDFPDTDITLVIDDRVIGTNLKISNLANMYPQAKYDILVIADSDMSVGTDYLTAIAQSFEKEKVGAATCLYTAKSAENMASKLGALYINEWFLPSVLVALTFQKLDFCFGATMCIRRNVLEEIGGFEKLSSLLADDHILGKEVSRIGHDVVLIPYLVENVVHERDFRALFLHELRWARTIRLVQASGYAFSFITYGIPLTLILLAVWPTSTVSIVIVTLMIALRLLIHSVIKYKIELKSESVQPWLIPVRDCLNFIIWVVSFLGDRVSWRNNEYAVQTNGNLENL